MPNKALQATPATNRLARLSFSRWGPILRTLILLSAALLTSCSEPGTPMRANAKELTVSTGTKFAEALVSDKYLEAWSLLTGEARQGYAQENLRSRYEEMTSYGKGPIKVDGHFEFLAEWPARQPQDIGWAYISISGSDFAEAVAVVVSDENGSPKIREIEWGRP